MIGSAPVVAFAPPACGLARGLASVPSEALVYLARRPKATAADLAERFTVSRATAHRWLGAVAGASADELSTELEDAGSRHSALAQLMVRHRRRVRA